MNLKDNDWLELFVIYKIVIVHRCRNVTTGCYTGALNMMWKYQLLLCLILAIKTNESYKIDFEQSTKTVILDEIGENLNGKFQLKDFGNNRDTKKLPAYTSWSAWSECQGGHRTRRRHCLRRGVCGDSLRVEVARHNCVITKTYKNSLGVFLRGAPGVFVHRDVPPLDGEYTIAETMAPPPKAIHPEDTRASTQVPPCGQLGRQRGHARTRTRMRDMLRIIGGRPAPPGKWPWQEAFCGGTLVSLWWVVTAAHCVRRRLLVRLGEHDLFVRGRSELEMRVVGAVVHPNYDPDTVVNDVAMLRLPAPARPELGHGIACLPRPGQVLPPHATCTILGWGKKRATDAHGTRILHEAQVSTVQQGVCRRSYWQYAITDDMVCAGRGRRDSCAGDSGGPLLCRDRTMRYYLQGITSFGDGCGKRGKYGIYTRTAGYVTWMRSVMNEKYFD
ncbi:Trypsin [Papilio machaon]|uniref:limulus clotting factor C n=1 Tax=Papilio machaon TaxID=76193 RepID=A0A194R126_PAPMA|nr:Trypsin [Papilio machaon]